MEKNLKLRRKLSIILLILSVISIVLICFIYATTKIDNNIISSKLSKLMTDIQEAINNTSNIEESFSITVKDDNDSLIANAKFIIKELIIEGEERTYSDPTDEAGNVLGQEENINGESFRVFETDENGNISIKLKDGIYEIKQIATSDGHIIDENNKIWTIGVNDTRENTIIINSAEVKYTEINSDPVPFHHVVKGREDGSSIYYNNNNLSFINPDNTIEWTKSINELEGSSGVIRQIEFNEDEIDCLYRHRIGKYDDEGNVINGYYRHNSTAYESFTIDSDGNYIWFGDYGDGTNRLLIDKFDSDFNKIEDGSEYGAGEGAIYGIGSGIGNEYAYTIIDTDEGYLITAYVGSQEITDKTGKTTTIGDSEYVILLIDKQTLEIKNYLDTKADSGYDDDTHKIHNVIKGKNGEIYYAGIFTGTINFSEENTVSGTPIELTSKGGKDGFVMKITKDLKIEWAISVGGEGNDNFYNADLTTDNGIILAGGSDRGNIQEIGKNTASGYDINTTPISENAGSNIGISAKINAEGKLVWANEFGYTSNETFLDVATLDDNNYILVGNENNGSGGKASYIRISEEEQDTSIAQVSSLEVVNERETYEIETSVNGEGGTISGSDDEVFKTVKYGEDCLNEIVITPNANYQIARITINGEEQEFSANEDGSYTLQLENIRENKQIEVTFELKSYDYRVEYYYDGELDNSKTETKTATYGDIINTYSSKEETGYRLQTAEEAEAEGIEGLENGVVGLPLTISENIENNVIKVYYVKNSFNYTIEYYYNEELDSNKTEIKTAVYGSKINEYPDKKISGYKFDKTENLPLTISKNSENNVIKVYYIEKEPFNINVKDDQNCVISNAKFIIKEVIFEGEERTYSAPTDEAGNVLGQEENINGESFRVFETNENGVISVKLKDGIYEIEQITTSNGHIIDENNKIWTIGVNDSRNDTIIVNIENSNYTDISGPNKGYSYYLKAREDGCSIYYYNGSISFIESNNEIKWTCTLDELEEGVSSSSTQINQIEFDESGFTCLFNNRIVKYNDDAVSQKRYIINDDTFYSTFTIDSDGNYILAGDYNNGNNRDLHLLKLNSDWEKIDEQVINGTGSENEYIYSIIDTNKGYIVSSYIGSNDIKVGETDETIAIPDNWVLMLLDKDTFEIKKWFNTQSNNTTNDFRKVHSVRKGQNGEIYYAGVFSGTINFSGENTVSGQTITLDGQGARDSFVLKLTDDLKIEWATTIVGPGEDSFYEFEITRDNGIFLVGETNSGNIQVEGEKTQSGYSIRTEPISGYTGTWRAIAAKVDSEGKVVWVKEFGLTNNEGFYDGVALSDDTYLIAARETPSGSGKASYIRISETIENTSIESLNMLEVLNERETYEIKTSVNGEGGTISGIDDEVYEFVEYGNNCTKEIVITPNANYQIARITINGEEQEFSANEDGSYTLQLENITEDKQVEVTYKLKSYGYRIEYYYDGQLDEEKTENKTAVYGSKINEYPDKKIAGYKFDKTENLPLTISGNSANNVIKVYYIEKEAFNINVKDDRNSVISNAKFIIKEVIFEGEERKYSDPIDELGNILGTEENINGETYRVFTTNEDGNISVKLKDGIYEIEQISTSDGHVIDENNKIWTIGLNNSRGNVISIEIEDPLYTDQTEAESVCAQYCVQGREDGCSIYYYKGYISFINADNTIPWTKSVMELEGINENVRQIEFNADGFVCLYEHRIVKYDNNGDRIERYVINNDTTYKAFTVDSNGNYILLGDYNYSGVGREILMNKFDSELNKINDGSIYGSESGNIMGSGDEYAYTIADTDAGYVVSIYTTSQEIRDRSNQTITVGDSQYLLLLLDKSTFAIKGYLDTQANSGYNDNHRVHNIQKSKNDEIYYVGVFTGTINFSGENTVSGAPIELTSKGGTDGFVMKITSDLKIEWAISIGGEGDDHFYQLDLTDDDEVFFAGDSDIGNIKIPGENTVSGYDIETEPISENANSWRGITTKINSEGKVVWIKEFGFSNHEACCYDVTVLNKNNYATVGLDATTDEATGTAIYVKITENELDTAIEEVSSLDVINDRETYEIKTSVNGEGGIISGIDDEVYESVKYEDDCTKEIIITPNANYQIAKITINGEEQEFKADEDGTYTLQLENITENKEIEVTYELKSYEYRVEYYYEGQLDAEKTKNETATYGDVINTYTPEEKTGYRLQTTEEGETEGIEGLVDGVVGLPLTISENTEENVIKVYYVKDSFGYTVEYYYDGELDNSKTITESAIYGNTIEEVPDENIPGYRLQTTEEGEAEGIEGLVDGIVGLPLTISENAENNIIKVYYVKDSFEYTVEYYYNGELDDSKTETEEAIYGSTIEEIEYKNIPGYRLQAAEEGETEGIEGLVDGVVGLPLTISENAENNVIKVYYVKDSFGYTVEYYYDGKLDNSKTITESAIYGNTIEEVPDENIPGYRLQTTEEGKAEGIEGLVDGIVGLPLTISENAENNIIKVYYVKDSFEYTVEYYYDGELDNSKTEIEEAIYGSTIEEIEYKNIPGYRLQTTEEGKAEGIEGLVDGVVGLPLTISENAENNVIKVYYIKDSFEYTVEYYYDGELDDSKTETEEAIYGSTIKEIKYKNIPGYRLQTTEEGKTEGIEGLKNGVVGLPLTISEKAENNVIKVYYVKDSFGYTIEFYYEGQLDEENIIKRTATYGDVINTYTPEEKTGYRLQTTEEGEAEGIEGLVDGIVGLPLTISEEANENVIRVYYVIDESQTKELSYTVEYYYDGNKKEDDSDTVIKKVQKLSPDIISLDKEEINISDKYAGTLLEKIKQVEIIDSKEVETEIIELPDNVKNGTIIRIYYIRKDAQVIVKYIDRDSKEEISDRVVKTGKVFDEFDVKLDEKEISGYTMVEEPEHTAGTYTEETQEKVYVYAKNAKVTVNYIDKNTQEKIDVVEYNGIVGEEYTAKSKDFEGYVLIEPAEYETITMTEEEIVLNYYYERISEGVIEKHIDIKTGELIEPETKYEGNEGTAYKTESKVFENYDLVEEQLPANSEGTMTIDVIEVKYYYIHKTEVIEKHIDVKTGELIEKETRYEGHEDDNYTTSSKVFGGYDLVKNELPENAQGTMTVEPIEVKYYYIRKTSVKVEYIDKVTGKQLLDEEGNLSTEYIYGNEDDYYYTEEKKFQGYDLVEDELPENAKGTMKVTKNQNGTINTETTVTYYYLHKSAGVIEKHIDVITGELLERETKYEGYENDDYSTQAKEFDGYELVEERLPENPEGKMTIEKIEIKYYYIRKVTITVEYLELQTGDKIQEDTVIEGYEGERYYTESKNIDGYKLLENKLPTNSEGIVEKSDIVVKYYYEVTKTNTPDIPQKPSEGNGNSGNNGNNNSNNNNNGSNLNNNNNGYNSNNNNNFTNNNNNNSNNSNNSGNYTQSTGNTLPKTGDTIFTVTIATISIVIALNLCQITIQNNISRKENGKRRGRRLK